MLVVAQLALTMEQVAPVRLTPVAVAELLGMIMVPVRMSFARLFLPAPVVPELALVVWLSTLPAAEVAEAAELFLPLPHSVYQLAR